MITVLVALLAAGCRAGTSSPEQTPAPVPSPSPSAASPAPTETTPPPLTAADGTKLKACADGTCEVIVKNGDSLPNTGGAGPVEVTVSAGSVTISTTGAGGFSSTLSGPEGTVQQLNDQVFLIVAVQGRRAVLRLSTK